MIASSEESKNHWQQKDYKGFNSSTDWDTADFSKVRLSTLWSRTLMLAHSAAGVAVVGLNVSGVLTF